VDTTRLQGRTALVTGASSGIGRQQAIALAGAGAAVILVGRREAALADTVEQIQTRIEAGTQAAEKPASHILAWDLMQRDSITDLAIEARKIAGSGIDILCNTAGVNHREPIDEITLESWDSTLNLN